MQPTLTPPERHMPHVLRDAEGRIVAVLDRPSAGGTEEIPADHPDLVAFLGGKDQAARRDFVAADLQFIRVLEDVIQALVSKGVLLFTDLPAEAQKKLLRRSGLRARWRESIGIVGEDDDKAI
ncbi:MAG: hypothetical protein ACT4P2_02055 [Pseudomonadota bacterium]